MSVGGVNKTRQKAFLDQRVRFSLGIIYVVIVTFSAAVTVEGGGLLPGAEQRELNSTGSAVSQRVARTNKVR